MEERVCLLFCDTFSHDNDQEMQLDLVRFAQPVVISEIRVIPQGCKVHPQIRDRLGETTPSSFKLEIFARNLLKPNATVFERLGVLDYEEGKSIQLIIHSKIATNFALVQSWYKRLTMCIYGTFAHFQQDQLQVPPPPQIEIPRAIPLTIDNHLLGALQPGITQVNPALGQIANLQQLHIQTQNIEVHPSNIAPHHLSNFSPSFNQSPREDRDDFRRLGVDRRREEDERDRRVKDKRDRFEDERRGIRRDYFEYRNDNSYHIRDVHDRFDDKRVRREEQQYPADQQQTSIPSDELFEPLSPENEFFENQPEEIAKKNAQIAYEDIESDEDVMLEDFDFDEMQGDFDNDETWVSVTLSFNPYQCSLAPLQFINPCVDSEFERLVKSFKETQTEPFQVKQLQDFVVSDSEAERDAKWVTMLEELPNIVPIAMAYLHSQPSQKIKEKHFLSIITEWAVFALSMDRALALPLAVNIRFLKAGIKLTCLLAECCEEYQRLLLDCDVQEKLLDLLYQSHMASSMKLIVLKALDATTSTVYGMEMMLGWSLESSSSSEKLNIYGRLINYFIDQKNARVIAAIKPLLQKAHFYEAAAKLQAITARVAKSQPQPLSKDESELKQDTMDSENSIKKFTVDVNISNKDMSDLLAVLSTIHEVLENGNSIIRQPSLQSFPTTARLHDINSQDCYPTIVHLLQRRRFLESILVLASSPLFCETELYAAIRDLIFLLISSNKGLLLLASQPNICNALIRALLSDDGGDLSYMPTLKQYRMNINTAEGCMPHHLGLLLVYHLQALQCVDKILQTAVTDLEVQNMDSSDHISALHTLYSMTFSSVGRESVSSVLSFNSNVNCLLPFLTGGDNFETKIKKSVSSRYSAVLLNITLQYSYEVDWLRTFKKKLLSIPKKENDNTHEDIHHFIAPLEKIESFDIHAVAPLIEFVKSELDEMKLSTGSSRSVLIAMRILYDLVQNKENEKDQIDLQGRLNVIEMFSSNAMEIFILTFHKVNEQLLLPWKQNQSFSNENCFILVNIANYMLGLTKVLLRHLLMTSFCFKDSRLIQELFVLHKILCSKPPVGLFSTMLVKMQEEIISLLILFLQGTDKAPESEDDVKKSTWYILLKELLTFLIVRPENFITGLVLLSELLPTPLPIHSLFDLQRDELAKVMSCRYLALVNFSCLGSELKTVIKTVVGSCCTVLQYYLRRSLCQLIDLGSSVSGIVIRTLCEMVDEGINKSKKESEEPSVEGNGIKKKFLPSIIYNAFSLLSYLVTQPGGKAAFLNLLSTTQDGVTEFPDFITKLISVLDKEYDFNYLGNSLLPLFQSICDHEVCLDDFDGVITMGHLSNNLLDEANTKAIVELLFATLNDDKYPIPVVMRSLNILESLTDHDFGMNILINYLIKKGDCLNMFLSRLIPEVKNKVDSLVYNAISSFFGFLNLINTNSPEDYLKPDGEEMKTEKSELVENTESAECKKDFPLKRNIVVSASLLKKIFKLDDKNTSEHPMTKLEKIIEEESKDDEELISLIEVITTFRMILIAAGDQDTQKDEYKPYELFPPDSLQVQFNTRMTCLLMNNVDDERATANDWFDEPAPDDVDSDTENDTVKVDMLSIATKFLPSFNFKEEVEKGFVDTTEVKRSKRSKRDGFFRAGQHIDDAKRLRLDVSALSSPNTANRGNERGRGRGGRGSFGRAGYNNRGGFQRGSRGFGRGRGRGRGVNDIDSFRLRRQNTSRPPSMHVDDFMNMEKAGQTVMTQQEQTSSPASNERFSNNNSSSSGTQSRWNSTHATGGDNFRRTNDGARHNDYNARQNYGNGRFHNRSNSDWHNSNYRGTRDGTYRSSARGGGGGGGSNSSGGSGGGSGGYWAAPKAKEDERFFAGHRNNRGNRHQRTFTR